VLGVGASEPTARSCRLSSERLAHHPAAGVGMKTSGWSNAVSRDDMSGLGSRNGKRRGSG
jgi:hypothetical protein